MKKFISFVLILISVTFAFAQTAPEKPLSQAEYVKLLYGLQNIPAKKAELAEIIRRRGIDFQLTDGLRGLTRTKSGADAEIARTLEESARRKENPTAYQPPSAKESAEVLQKSREATLAAVDEMPDFVVKQMIQRSVSYAGTNNFKNLDRLVVAVSYRSPDVSGAEGAEEYKVLSVNGVQQAAPTAKKSYEEVDGTSSTGEFVTVLATIFKAESATDFEPLDTDVVRGHKAIVYSFDIKREKAPEQIQFAKTDSTTAGMKGKIWIDRSNFRVLRLESNASEIPETFPITAASRFIDYDWVTIADEKYLLPLRSDVRLTSKESRQAYETRNLINFKEYQKFGSEVKILDDDVAEPVEEKPKP